ncbi:uncharacterized protein LOC110997161 isoform X1 [Pieris rapae]|uniref:uncharacterized protein LOC110997161 isoform X1 n=1 Tax=Pieris rapae TaxID=64459 RepID=UPI001E27E639|nr:uncharacterized protein LOC110997161 isoform X1 [Pieris rapae]
MTNVKLKLLFYLLNSLLSVDLVHSRPFSANVTDFINNNSTFTIPVDSNSDTLIVANGEDPADETPEETNKSSNKQMEAIVNAEQDRDEALSEKVIKDQVSILEMTKNEAEAFEKQLNTSSPLLESMIDSESDREETLTDILFRPESEFVEGPRFEFLIARLNETDGNRTAVFSDNNLDRVDKNSSDVLKRVDYVELVEVEKPNISENKSAYSFGNITGHDVDNDLAPDTILSMFSGYSDVQTLFMACFGTLLPLLAALFITLLVRCMCRRWCAKKPVPSSASVTSSKPDSNEQTKSPEDGDTGGETPPGNGSVFTMTLKNNHLIVETEERNDITKNGRATKMKYSPDNDGIFVVEVQQSNSYRPNNKDHQNSYTQDPQISTNQALIHRVPDEYEKRIVEDDSERSSEKFDRQLALSSTGLSISDLSMSSIGSHNVTYSYSSQMGYEQGPFGYPIYAGYDVSKDDTAESLIHDNSQEPLIGKTPTDPDKPVVTAAIFKQDSVISNDLLQGPVYCIEGSSDGPLLSDVQAREISLQKIHDKKEKKMENGVAVAMAEKFESPIKIFTRFDSVATPDVNIKETNVADIPKDVLKGKRASLPVIRTEMYESVKDVIQAGSPKFERLNNDMSPGEVFYDTPPMITITEESESKPDDTS